MAKFYPPPKSVIELADQVLKRYHEHLEDMNVGILFRDEAPVSDGHTTLGMAKKVTDEMRAAGLDFHFVIWFAEDTWWDLTDAQRLALVDHELMHCTVAVKDGQLKPKIRKHDFEEFNEIIERHGLWWPGAQETRQAIQQHTMPLFGRQGRVAAVDGAAARLVEAVRGIGGGATVEIGVEGD